MRVSLNEIKKLVPQAAKIGTDELVKLIGARLVEVEEAISLAPKYTGIYIVKVVECEAIPDTHLHLCKIDAGKNELIQVVCGAPNVHSGMLAVWIAPGSIVPQTYGAEDFKLDVRKLRGYESNGMLAAIDELDLGDDHEGIAVVNPAQRNAKTGEIVQPGDRFAEVYDLDDIVLDIENKSLTHRPDTFGLIGFAREVAGIMGEKFDEKNELRVDKMKLPNTLAPVITISDTTLCSRYSCAVIEYDDSLKDDKFLTDMDIFLAKAGMRGISRIVDITNYLMLMTGQPLHAFDYDKFIAVGQSGENTTDTPRILIRTAKDGEELQLLDGKIITCDANDILITSNDVPVALAGAMGGASTEIDASTKKIILESASFSLYHLRKTQMKHGIFSEAITRFTKGQPASQTMSVLESACQMLVPNEKGSNDAILAIVDQYPEPTKESVVKITTSEINDLLGTNYDIATIKQTLENVGFVIKTEQSQLEITAPLWRTDIHIREDIIEEVGRLLGYDNIALDYPLRPFACAESDPLLRLKNQLRTILSERLSAHEVLSYSFVSKRLQESVGEDPSDSYEIINSISPELQCFRQSIVPSLLEKVHDNLKAGYKDFSLYEINQVTKKSYGYDGDNVPRLYTHLAFVTVGDYYQMKANLVALLDELGFSGNYDFRQYDGHFPFLESRHSATITTPHICCGEVKMSVLKKLKIDTTVSAYEIVLEHLLEELPATTVQVPRISRYPSTERDLTLKVSNNYSFAQTETAIRQAFDQNTELVYDLATVSIYQPNSAPGREVTSRNITFRLHFASLKKTLTNAEISVIMDTVIKSVKSAVGAEII